ncbi:hypothetical protein H6503_00100 [Candidatus Woesearchaeota archaeon]|nr:hypothetical protein [Candidatus Woesearchaeota archaeon]
MRILKNFNDRRRMSQLSSNGDLSTAHERRMEIHHLRNNIHGRNMRRYLFKGWMILIYVILLAIMLWISFTK